MSQVVSETFDDRGRKITRFLADRTKPNPLRRPTKRKTTHRAFQFVGATPTIGPPDEIEEPVTKKSPVLKIGNSTIPDTQEEPEDPFVLDTDGESGEVDISSRHDTTTVPDTQPESDDSHSGDALEEHDTSSDISRLSPRQGDAAKQNVPLDNSTTDLSHTLKQRRVKHAGSSVKNKPIAQVKGNKKSSIVTSPLIIQPANASSVPVQRRQSQTIRPASASSPKRLQSRIESSASYSEPSTSNSTAEEQISPPKTTKSRQRNTSSVQRVDTPPKTTKSKQRNTSSVQRVDTHLTEKSTAKSSPLKLAEVTRTSKKTTTNSSSPKQSSRSSIKVTPQKSSKSLVNQNASVLRKGKNQAPSKALRQQILDNELFKKPASPAPSGIKRFFKASTRHVTPGVSTASVQEESFVLEQGTSAETPAKKPTQRNNKKPKKSQQPKTTEIEDLQLKMWDGGFYRRRRLSNILDLDVILNAATATIERQSGSSQSQAVKKSIKRFGDIIKRDLCKTIDMVEEVRVKARSSTKTTKDVKERVEELVSLEDQQTQLDTELRKLQREHEELKTKVTAEGEISTWLSDLKSLHETYEASGPTDEDDEDYEDERNLLALLLEAKGKYKHVEVIQRKLDQFIQT